MDVPGTQRRQSVLPCRGAFTLIELLVVLSIIGVLAALTLPHLGGMRRANTMVSAGRQLVDDLALARLRAISGRTTVHVIFVPPEILQAWSFSTDPGPEGTRDRNLGNRLINGPYTTYALYSERTVGDQPGRPHSRYLTAWRTLPDGVFIATNKYVDNAALLASPDNYSRPFEYEALPFPTIAGTDHRVPQVAFDPQGRLVNQAGQLRLNDEVIPLTRGSILYTPGVAGSFDVQESPPGNWTNNYHRVVVDGLTGRARVETPQIQ